MDRDDRNDRHGKKLRTRYNFLGLFRINSDGSTWSAWSTQVTPVTPDTYNFITFLTITFLSKIKRR